MAMPMATMFRRGPYLLGAAAMAVAAIGCTSNPPGQTFYQREIEPILVARCSSGVSGCHSTNQTDPFQFAAGNFDVTSFDNVQKRRDVLESFGAYSYPLLLVKAAGAGALPLSYGATTSNLQVQHNGGVLLDVNSDAFQTLLSWLSNGATENGLPPPTPSVTGQGACSTALPTDFDPSSYIANAHFAEFKSNVAPVLQACSSGSCHGAPAADFYITCGSDDNQQAFNFSQAWSFVNTPVDESQLLQVPLAVSQGGLSHKGGDQFSSRTDPKYLAIANWASEVGPIDFGAGDAGRTFFAQNVQPILLQRGCSFQACHSPGAMNDFKLRSGTPGFFSAISLERNYDLLKENFLALEFPDVRRGRAAAKTILPGQGGISHRGGPVLETQGMGPSDPANCPTTYDPTTATAFCTLQQWFTIERSALLAAGQVTAMDSGDTVPIVYVDRPVTSVAAPLEFDTYQPGADLRVADATLGAEQAITSVGASRSLLGNCGVTVTNADVRAPDVRLDGTTIAFAMRVSATDPLGVWTVNIDGTSCTRITPAVPDVSGIKIHNFDPAWSPDGEWIVFASTRGTTGPTRSRKLFLPQSDLWRMKPDGSSLQQVTFLTNSEMSPQFMREGRMTMTTEKVSDGFYQLAGRRLNWDLTDYHPLLAQRAISNYADLTDLTKTAPSVDYQQAPDIRENSDGDFLIILSDAGAKGGAGTLATFNRSVGPFESDRTDPGFLKSMHIIDPAATGRVGSSTTGAYRNPFGMPDGTIMVSYSSYTGDLAMATQFDWDIVAINPLTGARQTLIGGPNAQVDAVLAFKYPPRALYTNHRQLVFGGSVDPTLGARAVIHFPDAPMVFTLLTGNLRRGRPVDAFRKATQLAVYQESPAPANTTSGSGPGGIFPMRQLLGKASLASDGSAKVNLPAGIGLILELQDATGTPVVTMGEEHQLSAGETISMGVQQPLFNATCGGCHGSVSGSELDIAVTPDVLTGASQSLSAAVAAQMVGN